MFGENTKSHQSLCFSNPWCDPKWLYHFFRFTTIGHKIQPWFVFLLALALKVKTKSEAAYVFKKCHWLANWKCLAFFDKIYIFFNLPTHPLSNYARFNYIQRGFLCASKVVKKQFVVFWRFTHWWGVQGRPGFITPYFTNKGKIVWAAAAVCKSLPLLHTQLCHSYIS